MADFMFHPNTDVFDSTNALWLGEAAGLAYKDAPDVEDRIRTWGFDPSRFRFYDKNETQAFLAAGDEMILLAFRGTEGDNMKDWMTDIKVAHVKGPYGEVHLGFYEALNFVIDDIDADLDKLRDNGQPIWIAGHSLGAALAILATAELGIRNKPAAGTYTFGQPRVGNMAFADEFNRICKPRVFRFVNNNDVVTRVPLRAMGYSHVGTFRYFDAEGVYHESLTWWQAFLDRIQGRIDDWLESGTDGIKDHAMSGYLANLKRLAGT